MQRASRLAISAELLEQVKADTQRLLEANELLMAELDTTQAPPGEMVSTGAVVTPASRPTVRPPSRTRSRLRECGDAAATTGAV
jgi:hypothetical protein